MLYLFQANGAILLFTDFCAYYSCIFCAYFLWFRRVLKLADYLLDAKIFQVQKGNCLCFILLGIKCSFDTLLGKNHQSHSRLHEWRKAKVYIQIVLKGIQQCFSCSFLYLFWFFELKEIKYKLLYFLCSSRSIYI